LTPEKCPNCGAKLSPEMLACPNCPLTFPEGEEPSGGGNPLKHSPYWNFVLPALFFAALAAAIWSIGLGLFHFGEEGAKTYREKPNFLRPEKTAAEGAGTEGAGEAAPGPAAPAADKGGETAMISITPTGAGDAAGGVTAAARKPAPPSEWKLRGSVYDLTTLTPLAGCRVEFVDEPTNFRRQTRTDSTGRYRMILPPLDGRGYFVTVGKNGYAPNYLDPATPGVRDLDAANRRALARDLSATLTASPASLQAESAAPVVTDFYLAPRP